MAVSRRGSSIFVTPPTPNGHPPQPSAAAAAPALAALPSLARAISAILAPPPTIFGGGGGGSRVQCNSSRPHGHRCDVTESRRGGSGEEQRRRRERRRVKRRWAWQERWRRGAVCLLRRLVAALCGVMGTPTWFFSCFCGTAALGRFLALRFVQL